MELKEWVVMLLNHRFWDKLYDGSYGAVDFLVGSHLSVEYISLISLSIMLYMLWGIIESLIYGQLWNFLARVIALCLQLFWHSYIPFVEFGLLIITPITVILSNLSKISSSIYLELHIGSIISA